MTTVLRIATRGSELALWQTGAVGSALRRIDPGLEIELRVVRTVGDRVADVPLARIGDRGLFTKEVDGAVLTGEADLAIHSLKDVPTRLPEGLVLAAITEREDPRDVLICRDGVAPSISELSPGALVGTSSLRRRALIRANRPDIRVSDLRGNLNTRLERLDSGKYDAIVLAAAGVIRMGWRDRISQFLDRPDWLPAVGQGALAVVCREEDANLRSRLRLLHDPMAEVCTAAERAFLRRLEGGCQIPIGALGTVEGDDVLRLDGLIADLDGSTVLRATGTGTVDAATALGDRLAADLLDRGGGEILSSLREQAPPVPAP